jgi:hypothetical protein
VISKIVAQKDQTLMKLKHFITAMMLLLASTIFGQSTAMERNVTPGEPHPGLPLTAQKKFFSPDKRNLHKPGLSADHFSIQAVKGKKQKLDSIVYQRYDKTNQKWIADHCKYFSMERYHKKMDCPGQKQFHIRRVRLY